jgi:hypothetical protein
MDNALNLVESLNAKLIELLSSLSVEQWNKNTSHQNLKVKDIAIQLLDESKQRLLLFLNANDVSFNSYEVFDPKHYLAELQIIQRQLSPFLNDLSMLINLDRNESLAVNRPDLLEFYSKNWLYQQQIRQAQSATLLLGIDYYLPFLNYCMRSLPSHLAMYCSENKQIISIEIVAETKLIWQLMWNKQCWVFTENQVHADTHIYIDQNIAWILFSGGIDIHEASQYWQVIGNQELGRRVLSWRPFELV